MNYRAYRVDRGAMVLIPKELLIAEIVTIRFIHAWFDQAQLWLWWWRKL
jgi:hypothetical protein